MWRIGMLLPRIGLGVQIAALAGVGMAGVIALAGFLFLFDRALAVLAERAHLVGLTYDEVMAFDTALLQARNAEQAFLASGNAKEIARHESALGQAFAALGQIASQQDPSGQDPGGRDAGADPALRALAASSVAFRASAEDYAAAFRNVVSLARELGTDENNGLQGRLRASVHAAEAMLAGLADIRCQMWMLLLRRHEKDFLTRGTARYRDAFEDAFAQFTSALSAAAQADPGLDAATQGAIMAKMAAYRSDFLALVPRRLELLRQSLATASDYAAIKPLVEAWEAQALRMRADAASGLREARLRWQWRAVWVSLGVLAIMLSLAGLIGVGLTRALRTIVDAMRRLARDDRGFDLSRLAGRAEIGQMAAAIEVFRATAQTAARLAEEAKASAAASQTARRTALQALALTIEHKATEAMVSVTAMTTRMDDTSTIMAASANRTAGLADEAAAAAARGHATAQTVAAAADALSGSIGDISREVSRSAEVSLQAVGAAREARRVIERLEVEVRQIGQVSLLITGVAGRTNLLALNATIEAARAGEAGRGFAVVAGEVKALAAQTAGATDEITRDLTAITAAIGDAGAAMGHIEATIAQVDAVGHAIADAVGRQAAATAEIARSVAETASAAQTVSTRVAAMSEEAVDTGRHTIAVRNDTFALNDAVDDLKSAVIRAVRTSSGEVNRRASERFAVDLPCRIEQAGGTLREARVADISVGGALVRGAPGLEGGEARLLIEGHALTANVVRHDGAGTVSFQFVPAEGQVAWLSALIERERHTGVGQAA
jgi:methyl-accepting chemotaxis protein